MTSAAITELPAPLFVLRGKAARIDLSAWISSAVMFAGISSIGPSAIVKDVFTDGYGLYAIVASYLVFLATVLLIQKHMRIALSANTFGSAQTLVTSGIFQVSRNPIYVAYFIPLASFAYFSLSTAIACVVIYVILMNLTVIRKEERDLQLHFGAAFTAYRASVPRWLV